MLEIANGPVPGTDRHFRGPTRYAGASLEAHMTQLVTAPMWRRRKRLCLEGRHHTSAAQSQRPRP
jgi:hypothetical protein